MSATNRPLEEMVGSRGFREDLFFRLNVVGIHSPPLRERRGEVRALARHFLERFADRYGRRAPEPGLELAALLERYEFPGNIRELENMMKRIVVLGSQEPIVRDLLARERRRRGSASAFEDLLAEVEETAGEVPLREVGRRVSLEAERAAIEGVLLRTGWNRKRAARILQVSYKTLLLKIRECGLEPE